MAVALIAQRPARRPRRDKESPCSAADPRHQGTSVERANCRPLRHSPHHYRTSCGAADQRQTGTGRQSDFDRTHHRLKVQ